MNAERLVSALTPDHFSRSAYAGRVTQRETFIVIDAEGNPIQVERDVIISWDSIEQILKMVTDRAHS